MNDEERKGWARQLANNPLLTLLLEEMEKATLIRWSASGPDQVAEREQCHQRFQAVQELRNRVKSTSEKGD